MEIKGASGPIFGVSPPAYCEFAVRPQAARFPLSLYPPPRRLESNFHWGLTVTLAGLSGLKESRTVNLVQLYPEESILAAGCAAANLCDVAMPMY